MLARITDSPRLKKHLQRVIKIGWISIVVVFTAIYFWKNWALLNDYEWQIGIWWMTLALFCGLFRRLLGGIRWVIIILSDLSCGFFLHLRIQFISHLATYIPGSLWSLIARIQMTKNQGISLARCAFAAVLDMGLLVWSGLAVGLYAVSVVAEERWIFYLNVLVVLGPALVGLHTAASKCLFDATARLLRKPTFDIDFSYERRIAMLTVSIIVRIATGLTQYFLLKAFDPDFASTHLLYIISVTSLAWTIGFLAPWAPAGFGVREGVLIWFLEPILPLPLILAGVVASRVTNVIVDVVWAGISLTFGRKQLEAAPTDTA